MKSIAAIGAAAIVLSASAVASPFTTHSASKSASKAEASETVTLTDRFFTFALRIAGFQQAGIADADNDFIFHSFRNTEQCPSEDSEAEELAEDEADKKDKARGPEPIYFGF